MKTHVLTSFARPFSAFLLSLASVACSSSSSDDNETPGQANNPVVLLAERIQNPDSRQIYVSLLPELPSTPVDRSSAYEFGNVDIYTHGGKVFIFDREQINLTRYQVTEDYQLVEDTLEDGGAARVSFQQVGLPGYGFEHVFISDTRAYLVDWGEYRILVWNPTTMEIEGEIPLDVAIKDGYTLSDSYLVSAIQSQGKVFVGVYVWQTYEDLEVHPGSGVVVVDAESDAPAQLLEDNRITGASKLFTDEDDNVLVVGDQYSGLYNQFGPAAGTVPPAGVLRIDPSGGADGQPTFERDYFVDLIEVTRSPGIYASYQIDASHLLLQAWDPETPLTVTTADDYWAAGDYVYLLVDLDAGTSERVQSIPKAAAGSVEQFRFDDQLYVQTYEQKSEDVKREAIVHRVSPTGVEEAFRIPSGDLWALRRVR